MSDLAFILDPNQFAEYEITDKLELRRLGNMMKGEAETKEHFKYLSKHGIRSIVSQYINDPKKIEECVTQIPEDSLTGFHLKDILDKTKKYNELR